MNIEDILAEGAFQKAQGQNPHRLKIRLFKGEDNLWYWTAKAGNGEPIFRSTDGYNEKISAQESIEILRSTNFKEVEVEDEETKESIGSYLLGIGKFGKTQE